MSTPVPARRMARIMLKIRVALALLVISARELTAMTRQPVVETTWAFNRKEVRFSVLVR